MGIEDDQHWQRYAIQLAERAAAQGEVPVGAVLVLDNKIIGEGWNQPITLCDPSAHAEIVALRQGAKSLANYRLNQTTLYVTLEPCAMCAGAMIQARIKRLVYGASDPRAGAITSVFTILDAKPLNHRIAHTGGVLSERCGAILVDFFKGKRN